MSALWDNVRKFGTYVLGFVAGLILWIDPSHIDNIVAAHPKWSGVILFIWTALVSWASKTKPKPQPDTYPPGTGQNPVAQSHKPYAGGTR